MPDMVLAYVRMLPCGFLLCCKNMAGPNVGAVGIMPAQRKLPVQNAAFEMEMQGVFSAYKKGKNPQGISQILFIMPEGEIYF